jgi:hypothetical protein
MKSVGKFFAGVSRLARKLAGDEAGSPAVEFALVSPIFIGVVLATLQAASIFLVKAFLRIRRGSGCKGRSHQSDRLAHSGAVPN